MDNNENKTKKCGRCGHWRYKKYFSSNPTARDGLNSWCKKCSREYARERRANDPSRRERDRWITRTYNMALGELQNRHTDEFEEILDQVREENPAPA